MKTIEPLHPDVQPEPYAPTPAAASSANKPKRWAEIVPAPEETMVVDDGSGNRIAGLIFLSIGIIGAIYSIYMMVSKDSSEDGGWGDLLGGIYLVMSIAAVIGGLIALSVEPKRRTVPLDATNRPINKLTGAELEQRKQMIISQMWMYAIASVILFCLPFGIQFFPSPVYFPYHVLMAVGGPVFGIFFAARFITTSSKYRMILRSQQKQ